METVVYYNVLECTYNFNLISYFPILCKNKVKPPYFYKMNSLRASNGGPIKMITP